MNGKLTLAFSVASFVAIVGLLIAFSVVLRQMETDRSDRQAADAALVENLERVERFMRDRRAPGATRGASDPASRGPTGAAQPDGDVPAGDRIDTILEKLQELSDDNYDTYNDLAQELVTLRRDMARMRGMIRRVIQGLGRSGGFEGLAPQLPKRGLELSADERQKLVAAAAEHGITVEPGRVTVRGFLNLSPNTSMPIEYFITRYPESSHETLVHIVGTKDPEVVNQNPWGALKGLATGLYKGLLAAGFREGQPGRPDPDADPKAPRWLLPTGDVVYVYVRYEMNGATHLVRATDWILDPTTGKPLPEDCFRFSGGIRVEDPDTGDEMLLAEARGLLVSVYPIAGPFIEVALESAASNNFTYNASRIPKPEAQLFLDVVFSREQLEPQGDGAR